MKIYISGPVTGTTDYQERFEQAETALKREGNVVINPVKVNAGLPEGTTHAEYMQISFAMMELCEMVFFLHGWEHSRGCLMEMELAKRRGMTIVFAGGQGCQHTQNF